MLPALRLDTQDITAGRLTTHRRGGKIKGGASLEAAYVIVPESGDGQSAARMVEAQAIQVWSMPVSCRLPCRPDEGTASALWPAIVALLPC